MPVYKQFNIPLWKKYLKNYSKREYIINGLINGFSLNIRTDIKPTFQMCNILGTLNQQIKITQWIVKRHAKGQLLGPFTKKEKTQQQKKNNPGEVLA